MVTREEPRQFEIDCKITNQKVQVVEQRFEISQTGGDTYTQIDRDCQHRQECHNNGIDCIFAFSESTRNPQD